jgi:hypothetical protein
MMFVDYQWDLNPQGIVFDEELNIDQLGWKSGDYFKITNRNGRAILLKVDPVEAFVKGHAVNKLIEGNIK